MLAFVVIHLTPQDYNFQSHPSEIEGTFSAADESALKNGTLMWAYGSAALTQERANDSTYTIASDISPWVTVQTPAPLSGPLALDLHGVPTRIAIKFELEHNQLYFLNVKSQNRLGFWGAGASKGVLIDLIPPFAQPAIDPERCSDVWVQFYNQSDVIQNLVHQGKFGAGLIGCENMADYMSAEGCAPTHVIDWMSTRLNGHCIGPTPLPNHRRLVDSGTVFNGDSPGTHVLWQLEQTFVSLSWWVLIACSCLRRLY